MSTSIPFVVLDWLILEDNGNYIREGKASMKSMSSILSPRKEYQQYRVGEQVVAKFGSKEYKADIIAIGNSDDRARLLNVAEGKLNPSDTSPTNDIASLAAVVHKDQVIDKVLTEPQVCTASDQKDLVDAVLKKVRKPIVLENSEQVQDPEMGSSKKCNSDCVSRKEFLELKDEVKRLRRKIKEIQVKTEKTVEKQMSQPVSFPTAAAQASNPLCLSPSPICNTERSQPPETDEHLYNGHKLSVLQDSISHTDKIYNAVKILLRKLFAEEYIMSHSVSGKAANSKVSAKLASIRGSMGKC